MSYILDALRKSESERRQGRVPDLGVSVQMVHKPRRRRIHWSVWVTLALMINAAVFGFMFFYPNFSPEHVQPRVAGDAGAAAASHPARIKGEQARPAVSGKQQAAHRSAVSGAPSETVGASAPATRVAAATPEEPVPAQTATRNDRTGDGATVIHPHSHSVVPAAASGSTGQPMSSDAPPRLGDMPPAFQRKVPSLHFNGHIFSSNPGARRVIINNAYLGEGDTYRGLTIDEITPDGVVMSMDGRQFQVGVVRDWIKPN